MELGSLLIPTRIADIVKEEINAHRISYIDRGIVEFDDGRAVHIVFKFHDELKKARGIMCDMEDMDDELTAYAVYC